MSTDIRTLREPAELQEMVDLLQAVWGTSAPIVTFELLAAVAHSGGYVAAAITSHEDNDAAPRGNPEMWSQTTAERNPRSTFRGWGTMVGASLGLLARHGDRPALHSHVTGLLPATRGMGLGRALKLHQRDWAIAHDLDVITWTFDPLVRRNAWFNIAVLGADVDEYLPSFYGVMNDAINAGDESDRLHVVWDLASPVPTDPRDGSTVDEPLLVPTPDDIVALRHTDPAAVAHWRSTTRDALTTALTAGRPIAGFTRDGNYVIGSTP